MPAEKASSRSTSGTAPIKVAIVEDDDWIGENLASQIDLAPGYRCVGRTLADAIIERTREPLVAAHRGNKPLATIGEIRIDR